MVFFGTSLVLIFLALALKTGSAQYQAAGKALGVIFGLVASVFLLEYGFSRPVSTFDTLLFGQLLFKAGGTFPGRPAVQTCATFFMLAVATLVFDQKTSVASKRSRSSSRWRCFCHS